MAVRFVLGSGTSRTVFDRAPKHTAKWDQQKQGFRMSLGMPAVGHGPKA